MAYEIEFEFDSDGKGEFRPSSNVVQVITNCLKQDDIKQAASLLAAADSEIADMLIHEAESGASKELWRRLAKLFGSVRDAGRAARCAEAVGDPQMAAGFHEAAYDWLNAAKTYQQAGILPKAAEMYERGLYFDKAAAVYLQSKDYLRAAGCYTKAGANYHAGHLYMKVGRYEQAVEVLQKVNRTQKFFMEASTLLGRFFEKTGNIAMAIERYMEVVHSKPIEVATVDAHHRLAVLLTNDGKLNEAASLWKAVLEIDPNHKGATDSLKLLTGKVRPSMPPPSRPSRPSSPKSENEPPPLVLPGDESPPPAKPKFKPKPKPKPASVVLLREDFDVFRALPIFSELSLEELRMIHTLAERTTFKPGQVLIEAESPGDSLFVIASGKVKVELISKGKAPVKVATLGQGASIGEMSLLDEAPASARVTALESVTAFSFPTDRLRTHMAAAPRVGYKIMRVLSRILSLRLREANLSLAE